MPDEANQSGGEVNQGAGAPSEQTDPSSNVGTPPPPPPQSDDPGILYKDAAPPDVETRSED